MTNTFHSNRSNPKGWLSTSLRGLFTLFMCWVFMISSALAATEEITYIHTDISGSPMAATDAAGTILWRESYRGYGERWMNQPASYQQNQWFHGKELDATGMQYFGARYYDPEIGRFTGIDPVGFQEENPHSFNRFAYGNNNPIKYKDPDGNNATTAFGGLIVESFKFATGQGFDGAMVLGALKDGYNGEGAGFAWSAAEDALNVVAIGQAVRFVQALRAVDTARTAAAITRAEMAASSAAKLSLQQINITKRISASGMGNAGAGKLFGWKGNGQMVKDISSFSREMLESNGWTREIIRDVAKGYRDVAKVTPHNPSALPRANQLESLLKLWD